MIDAQLEKKYPHLEKTNNHTGPYVQFEKMIMSH